MYPKECWTLVGLIKRYMKLVNLARESFLIMVKMTDQHGQITAEEAGWNASN